MLLVHDNLQAIFNVYLSVIIEYFLLCNGVFDSWFSIMFYVNL